MLQIITISGAWNLGATATQSLEQQQHRDNEKYIRYILLSKLTTKNSKIYFVRSYLQLITDIEQDKSTMGKQFQYLGK